MVLVCAPLVEVLSSVVVELASEAASASVSVLIKKVASN